jgi:MEMO1 family protein
MNVAGVFHMAIIARQGQRLAKTPPMSNRSPAVAGLFYPAEPDALDRMVRACLAGASAEPVPAKAVVAPHAGYVYSGPIAGTSFGSVAQRGGQVKRVILIGPSHFMRFAGLAAPSATGLATPLGTVPVDTAALDRVLRLPDVRLFDEPYAREHALEVELPFIQVLFPGASVVPLLVGEASAEAVEQVLEALWGGPETLIVISSDLSHYHDYQTAQALDLRTSQAIETAGAVDGNGACGYQALAGLLRRAGRIDLRATTRDLRNSGDTKGPRDRVVGYGAYTFEYAHEARLTPLHRQHLIDAAYATLHQLATTGQAPAIAAASVPWPLRALRSSFVTLEVDGEVRGCVGTLKPADPLIVDVVTNTRKAAMQDRRFPPMTPEELAKATVSISILSHLRPLPFRSEAELLDKLRPEVDGLMLRDGDRHALFLPKVWEALPQPRQFLAALKEKARLPPGSLSTKVRAMHFTTETFA